MQRPISVFADWLELRHGTVVVIRTFSFIVNAVSAYRRQNVNEINESSSANGREKSNGYWKADIEHEELRKMNSAKEYCGGNQGQKGGNIGTNTLLSPSPLTSPALLRPIRNAEHQ